MSDYLRNKEIFDTLAFAGHSVSEKKQILHVLTGLNSEYDSVVVMVTSRVEPFSTKEVTSLLLTFEARLEKNNQNITENMTVNFTANQAKKNINYSRQGAGGRGQNQAQQYYNGNPNQNNS